MLDKFGCIDYNMHITAYKHMVLLLRKEFNREEGKPKRRCLTVAAAVGRTVLFHCEITGRDRAGMR